MNIPKKIRNKSKLEEKTLIQQGLKLCEEAGELAAEILKYEDLKASEKSKREILDDLRLEAVDCMLMAMSILTKTNTSDKKIDKIVDSQIKKWKTRYESNFDK